VISKTVRGFTPKIADKTWIAENAVLIGDVEIAEQASIWYNCVLRGDVMPIRIGEQSNIQDGSVIHGTYRKCGVLVGRRVTVGHQVTLHGCTIKDTCLIGMGSIVMDQVVVGEHCLVGAGSLLPEGKIYPPRSLILGRPGVVIRSLTDKEILLLEKSADNYLLYKTWYEQA
jgi:gamma-carbonic anhydrase